SPTPGPVSSTGNQSPSPSVTSSVPPQSPSPSRPSVSRAPTATPPAPTPTPTAPTPPPVNRTGVTSYDRMDPGAPHWGFTRAAWQDFKAASNTITKLGVRWGNFNMPPGPVAGMSTHVVLCASGPTSATGCSDPVVAGDAAFVNYGASVVEVGDVAVTPGQTYWLFY